ncbi:hypothetical protein KTS45_12525 [Halomicroarcula limicola]|uniref:Uncharacterized protein n=1 Tax=Haloarcula limicola TaxID=1429915 RepID=A0A8J7Y683_9EURY|nr:hypothetical protein [Halomicroarcula limicola]MBV0925022.1 hypothetical protein [Halomicroarcula limicola]
MTERDRFVHLAGYTSITAVLATANWAGLSAVLLAAPLVLGTLYIGGQMLVSRLVERAREDADLSTQPSMTNTGSEGAARTDGGQEVDV